jgi:DedD protein
MAFRDEELSAHQIEEINIQDNNGLQNISLNDSDDNDKKKYLLLGVALSIVFIITLVNIKYISNSNDNNANIIENTEQEAHNNTEDASSEVRYQELTKNDNIAQDVKSQEPVSNIPSIILEDLDRERSNQPTITNKIVNTPKQKVITKITRQTSKVKVATKLNGSFIQLGAYSKYPSKQYLKSIQAKGYIPTIYKIMVKNKYYYKVLIGPYKNKKLSRSKLNKVRKDLNSPKAFIYK